MHKKGFSTFHLLEEDGSWQWWLLVVLAEEMVVVRNRLRLFPAEACK